ncbi:tetratricopeptide repeat protein [Stenotrophomonas sp. MMGLT7]|uniref:tetratricopeptide repeat protein n=1 Tax=Stenotrophomonas sp. MMGLT7 TaxID=2901227 RepID=UPI001E54B68F|nr:tetratricopeptide repeat protein [Stenotrophomonas sp. MMGLT7]MCD7099912.1 tetratricopeptide repeat protein [Stenotrophomonas sp. MMGLT7]
MHEQIAAALRRNAADEAVALARRWTTEEPASAQAWYWLSLSLQQAGEPDPALDANGRALRLAPEDAGLHLQQAGLLLARRDVAAADSALARTTELDPNRFTAYLMQAHLAAARGELDEAERLSRTAARLAPEHPELMAVDGIVALRRGDAERALALLSQASKQLPDDPRVLYALGFAYMEKGHPAFAERAFTRVVELSPAASTLRMLIAQLALQQGHADDARAALEPILQAQGIGPAAQRLAGEIELGAGRPAEAAAHLRQALAALPGDRRTLQALLTAWERLGTEDEARATLEAALATTGDSHELWLARLAIEPVGGAAARALIERWQAAMPAHLPALEAQMRVHDMAGERDQAEAVARRIVAIEPGRVSGEQRIVEALLQRDPPAAVAYVQELVAKLPEQARGALLPWLGSVQDRAGQADAAVASWCEFNRQQAPRRLPLPPVGAPPEAWPALAQVDAGSDARPLLVWGAPGSAVEQLVAAMAAASRVVRGDRFGAQPPDDAFQRYATVADLASGALAPQALVDEWRARLPARGIGDGNVIDWLLWWDNALLLALRQALPEGRLVLALRDPRDMLLDWLAHGAPAPLALESPLKAAGWLAIVLNQLATLHEQDLYPHHLLRLDGIEADPQALAGALQQAFGVPFPPAASLAPARLPAGHWRRYRDVLAEPFALLAPVSRRLGYPET